MDFWTRRRASVIGDDRFPTVDTSRRAEGGGDDGTECCLHLQHQARHAVSATSRPAVLRLVAAESLHEAAQAHSSQVHNHLPVRDQDGCQRPMVTLEPGC